MGLRCPQRQVVAEKLHDSSAVLVLLLIKVIKLGDGIIECLLSHGAGSLWLLEDLVVEDREVEGESEADWVGWLESVRLLGDLLGLLIGALGVVG